MNILTAFPIKGFFYTLILFAFCFLSVYVVQLAHIGWKQQHTPPPPEEKPKEEEKKPSENREPIYYIVERKTKRAKPTYGEPKQINFKP